MDAGNIEVISTHEMNLLLRNQSISVDQERELNMLCKTKWYDNLQVLGSIDIHRQKKIVSAIVCSTLLTP